MPPILVIIYLKYAGEIMTIKGYISNAAKMLAGVVSLLLVANIIVFMGTLGNNFCADLGSKLSSLATYIVLIVAFVAFNGEGIGHKRGRNRKAKKATGYLKFLLFVCFASIYFKGALSGWVLKFSATEPIGIVLRLGGSIIYTVTAYSFLFLAVSLWYLLRDSGVKKLQVFEAMSFIFAGIYSFFKFFNYAITRFGINFSLPWINEIFSKNAIAQILCILQYAVLFIMLIAVSKYYEKLSEAEEKQNEETNKLLFNAKSVFDEKGYGIDTFEDDFLIEE